MARGPLIYVAEDARSGHIWIAGTVKKEVAWWLNFNLSSDELDNVVINAYEDGKGWGTGPKISGDWPTFRASV